MASSNHYEYENEASVDVNLKCAICKGPFINPVTTPCHHTFCRQCLRKWLENYRLTCPTCRNIMSKHSPTLVTLLPFLAMLDHILVKCKICNQSKIQRGNFQDHINKICPKTIIRCPNNNINCSWKGLREELQSHLSTCTLEPSRFKFKESNNEIEVVNSSSIFQVLNKGNNVIFMKVNPQIEHVTKQEIAAAARVAINNKQCTHLNLFGRDLLPENVLLIALALPGNTSLKILELEKCSVHDSGVFFLAESLSINSSVEYLNLCDNHVTDVGTKYLTEMLRENHSLSRLELSYNIISNEGMKMLADAIIHQNSKLERLNLMGNKLITDSSFYSIFNIIKFNRTLKTVNLKNCNISWSSRMLIQFYQKVYFRTDLKIFL